MNKLPEHNIASFVSNLAKKNNIEYQITSTDLLGKKLIEIDGGTLELDETKGLLLALTRENIITSEQMLYLLSKLIEEMKI